MECEARIDDWPDRELMSRLALVSSLEEGRDEVVEGSDDGEGVDSKLAMILLPFIEVDADDDMEVFVTLDVAMAAAAVVTALAAAAATLQVALILFCLLNRHTQLKRISSAGCHHRNGMSRDYQFSFSKRDKRCNRCGYRLCFDQHLQ